MKFLFVDDDMDRHFLIDKSIGRYHKVIHTFTAKECVKIISKLNEPIDVALLDFDLGKSKISGLQLIQYLYQYVPPVKWFKKIICHTHNFNNGLQLVSRASSYGMPATYYAFSSSLLNSFPHN